MSGLAPTGENLGEVGRIGRRSLVCTMLSELGADDSNCLDVFSKRENHSRQWMLLVSAPDGEDNRARRDCGAEFLHECDLVSGAAFAPVMRKDKKRGLRVNAVGE